MLKSELEQENALLRKKVKKLSGGLKSKDIVDIQECFHCGDESSKAIVTPKRTVHLCRDCGTNLECLLGDYE
jgi:hypothetical protein